MKRFSLACLLALLPVVPSPAEEPYLCHRAEAPIQLDGKADEPAWRGAREIPHFFMPGKAPAIQATTRTRARLLWDDTHLYYFAEMEDGALQATRTERDGELWLDDVFELFFKPKASEPGYYEFQATPLGTLLDIHYPERSSEGYARHRNQGSFGHAAKVFLRGAIGQPGGRDNGWQVEGRIPWTDFKPSGGAPQPGDEWRFILCRYDYDPRFGNAQKAELSTSSAGMVPDFHAHEHYAPIRFEGPLDTRTLLPASLRAVRGFKANIAGTPEPPPPCRAERAFPQLDISQLVDFQFEPGTGRLFYLDKLSGPGGARLMRLPDRLGSSPEVILQTPEETLYSLIFHPRYQENGEFFVSNFGPNSAERDQRRMEVRRYRMKRDGSGQVESPQGELIVDWLTWGHTGGAMAFDDAGLFHVTTGDGTGDSDTKLAGQDLTHLLAKVLRLDLGKPADGKAYSVPPDNPFVGQAGIRPETFAYGFRNPWRMAWDRRLKRLWVGNNGQDLLEQVYLVERGANYGWSVHEGSAIFYADRPRGPHPISPPTLEHHHIESRSLTGGVVYEGKALPELTGAYVYGDHSTGKIWAARHDGTQVTWKAEIADTTLAITQFGTDPETGDLLVAHHAGDKNGGGLYRLVPNPPDPNAPPFPLLLSQTGLFKDVAGHQPREELLSYDVIVPQWADGAECDRYLALPEAGSHIPFTPQRGWTLPDNTHVIQTLSLGGRRLETRLLTRQSGEWAAYSYAWNEAQTDASLLPADGAEIPLADGRKWKVPSRADCMNCHSRAANFILGLQTPQLNKEHDYGGGYVRNQLAVMDDLGLFRPPGTPRRPSIMREPPEKQPRLPDPFDEANADVDARARAYLHARCSHCHVEAGGGNSMMDLRYFIEDPAKAGVVGVQPNHGDQGIAQDGVRIVAPGDPVKSVLFNRISKSGPGQMPPIGADAPDPRSVGLLLRWIMETPALPASADTAP